MAFEVFPWNEWIRLLIGGDEAPFFNGLRRAVYGYRFLRGKSAEDLRRDYGDDDVREDLVQDVALRTLHLLDVAGGRSDEDLARYIATTIRNVVTDRHRRQRNKMLYLSDNSGSSSDFSDERKSVYHNTPDLKPTPEAELMSKQLINSIQRLLTPRQVSILRGYEGFGIGPYSTLDLALMGEVSIKAIEKQVSIIKRKVRKFALDNGYLTPGDNPVRDAQAAKNMSGTPKAKVRR